MKRKILGLAMAVCAIAVTAHAQYCTADHRYTEAVYFDSTEITIGTNVQYGIANDFQGNPDTLLMDLYYPNLLVDPSPKRPFVLLFHGGGFSSGDKQSGDIRDLCIHLAMRGFVCASANYRLGHDFSEYGQYKARYRAIQDGHAAMRFVVNSANAVRADTSWLFVGGQSAGSLLALGMVYADPSELDSVSLQYSVTSTSTELGNLYSSGNNLSNTYSIKGIFNNWGGVTGSEVDAQEMLPTVAFHGELDTLVPIDVDPSFAHYTLLGSRAMHNQLTGNAVCSDLTVDTLGGHGIYRNASSVFRARRASCFFKSLFCSTCADFYSTDSIAPTCSAAMGAQDMDMPASVRVYPNPFQDVFKIQGLSEMADLRIYDPLGQLVYQEVTAAGAEVRPNLDEGIYFLHLQPLGGMGATSVVLVRK